jgi:CyaY protein
MNQPAMMNESEFHLRVDTILMSLEAAFDDTDVDIDSELASGILTLTFENGSKVIVNRQTPNREIWVAAKSGGFHFRLVDNAWRDTRSGEALADLLSSVISQQCGTSMAIHLE